MKYIKATFLGVGNGLENDPGIWQSSVIVSHDGDELFIDCGTDFTHSLRAAKRSFRDVKNLYISHIHSDHAGGLETLGFSSRFLNPPGHPKIKLYAASEVRRDLNIMLQPSMRPSIPEMEDSSLQACFEMRESNGGFKIGKMKCQTIRTLHVNANGELYSYGLFIEVDKHSLLFTSDTQFAPEVFMEKYKEASIILHDCSTGEHAYPAHPHITQLATLPPEIKAKMYLYHCGPGPKPDYRLFGFKGYARQRDPITVR